MRNESPNHASTGALATPQYYPYPTAPYGPPQFQPQPPSHLQPALNPQNVHGILQHPSPCNGQPPQDGSPPPNQLALTQKDEKFQRPTYKFRRKSDSRSKDKLMILPNQTNSLINKREKRKYRDKYDDSYCMNGSSASGSNASEDEEVTWLYTEYLSNLKAPVVTELSPFNVMVRWKPPDLPAIDIDPALCTSIQQGEVMYEVMISEQRKEGRYKSVYSGMDHHCNITSLKPDTEYFLCVQALLDDIRGGDPKVVEFKTPPAELETPQPPRLYSRTKNSLTLTWHAANEIASSKVKNYLLEYDEGYSNNSFVLIYSGPLKQYKVTKLSPATGYKFRLAAVSDKGKSSYSETCCYFTSGNAPSQPSPPVLKQAFINRLHLEWEKRPFDDDFSLEIEDENNRHGFFTAYNGREANFICCGLRGNTEYKFRLCASNEEGTSPWSKVVIYCTLPDKLSCPGKPISKGRIHASCFRVTWETPKDYKQTSITKYILEVDRGFGFEAVYTGPDTEYFLENLLPGTTYKVRVACISSAGHSPYSEVNSLTTAAVNPGKCALPKLQSKPEASFVCLDWAHPEHDGGSAVSEYEVDMTSPDNVTQQVYKGPETSCIVNGLLPGRPYLFQVRAYNRAGAGPFSDPLEVVSGAGPPDAPRNLLATCDSPNSCVVSWEEPLNNGAAITGYQLQWSTEDDEESFSEIYEGISLKYEIQGLMPATPYYFKVRALNEAGHGPNSDIVICMTPASVPGVISSINVTPLSNALCLSWSEAPSNGSEITSYNVELDDVLYNTEENVLELCIEELSPETTYRIRMQAINSVGEGPFSEPFEATTLKSPPKPPTLECLVVSHNFLRLKWGEGRNEESLYFTLEMSSKSKSFVPIYHGPGQSYKVSRLQENTSFQFRICASSESGQGPYSPVYSFQTSLAPPPSLKAVKVLSVTENSCQIEWSGAKPLPGCICSYQVHLASPCGDNVIVYQGSDTRYTIDNLEPSTQYTVKVTPVRHFEERDLVGSCSPSVAFITQNANVQPQALVAVHQTIPYSERRTSNDRQLAVGLVIAFSLFSGLVAMFLEHVFCLSTPS
ncbi:fibronectin type-III domain-containing protein 3A-like isoform X2 [Uloborus diversus]|uniref:fibronectin type-III domain-containing protein 3A-like isoform X2 n=1 Tax=Uloborus diversus TaxID=327109 RepID=UPI0024092828|nr:fibronectin type-III domain-containing protein 3A-like isoform X2 [Uloborus diversus]